MLFMLFFKHISPPHVIHVCHFFHMWTYRYIVIVWLAGWVLFWLLISLSRVFPGPQLVKKFPTFHGTWSSITRFTIAHRTFPVHSQRINPSWRSCEKFCNIVRFSGEQLLAPCSTPKLEDHPLSAVCDCLFNIFTATSLSGGCSSIHNLRMCHTEVTGTNLKSSALLEH